VQGGLELHELLAGHEQVERGLLQRDADPRADGVGLLGDVVAGHAGVAAGGAQQRDEHADRRGLAGAVGAQEPVDLAGLDGQVDAVHRLEAALVFTFQAVDFDGGHGEGDYFAAQPSPGGERNSDRPVGLDAP
jgi:hypothetical protein